MSVLLYLIRIHFAIIYFFIKVFTKQKKQVFLLSRQFATPSINYQILMDEFEKKKIPYKIMCEKVENIINDSLRTQGNYSNTFNFIKKVLHNFKYTIKYYFSLYRQMVHIAQSKVIIVDGYNLPISSLNHKKNTKIIQMWHALGAIKKFGYQSIGKTDGINPKVAKILRMHYGYDYVLSGSEGMREYFAEAFNIDIEKVIPIGTPMVDYLKQERPESIEKLYKKYPELKHKINVLYSPTFRNNKKYNYDDLISATDFKKINLIVTQHSKVEKQKLDDRVIVIDSDEFSTFDVLKICDYVITDYSALMIDACILNKKVLLYTYDFEEYSKNNGINLDLKGKYSFMNYDDAETIIDIIVNNKYDIKKFESFKREYTPHIKLTSTEENIKLIMECLND